MLKPLHRLHGVEIEDGLASSRPVLAVEMKHRSRGSEVSHVGIMLHPSALDRFKLNHHRYERFETAPAALPREDNMIVEIAFAPNQPSRLAGSARERKKLRFQHFSSQMKKAPCALYLGRLKKPLALRPIHQRCSDQRNDQYSNDDANLQHHGRALVGKIDTRAVESRPNAKNSNALIISNRNHETKEMNRRSVGDMRQFDDTGDTTHRGAKTPERRRGENLPEARCNRGG
jgi:hypothetical protein